MAATANASTKPEGRATSTVKRSDLERHMPGSITEALQFEAGVFIVDNGLGDGAVYVRGLTGQQTLLLFDGIRLNNSTWRRGPQGYFSTVDVRTLDSIVVQRGGGSTQGGSDAMGGVLDAQPIAPSLRDDSWRSRERLFLRASTPDAEIGGRAQLELAGPVALPSGRIQIGFLGGVGVRKAGPLMSAGSVENLDTTTPAGRYPYVPAFAADRRTQLGTGFKELTADGRVLLRFNERVEATLAATVFRQYDKPRTDQCPPPTASFNTCLTDEEDFRHLVYGALVAKAGRAARRLRITASWQQQHERARLDDPAIQSLYRSLDDVHTFGLTARAVTDALSKGPSLSLSLSWGADTYVDLVSSAASQSYTDVSVAPTARRGLYLDGARYLYGGAFLDAELAVGSHWTVRAGGRLSWFGAWGPGETGNAALSRSWVPVVGHAGVEYRPLPLLALLANVDHSFRAPNLFDLTGSEYSGAGYVLPNPALDAERATTLEAGVRVRHARVVADVWAFETLLQDAILRVSRDPASCPASANGCASAWSVLQPVNAPALSEVRGVEGAARVLMPVGLNARATLSYAWGEGPRVGGISREPNVVLAPDRIPLSRIPPLNGAVELWWIHAVGFQAGATLRWAAAQTRLSIEDLKDGRIPKYGTPGFAVVDARLAYRIGERLTLGLLVRNLFDTPFRYHGSAVNGPGRGVVLQMEGTL